MKILVTNDDGIYAEGIKVLVHWARKLGEVTVVAPRIEQSAKSQSIDIHNPFAIRPAEWMEGVEAYAIDSTPADCIRVAQAWLGREFDLVLSGINRGYNLGWDIVYSATCGAIFEAAYNNWPAIAFSTWPKDTAAAASNLDRIYNYILKNRLLEHCRLLNVNIPPEAGSILWTRQAGPYYRDRYLEAGEQLIRADGYSVYKGTFDPSLDLDAVMNGHISVSPLTVSRTDEKAFQLFSPAE